MKSTFIGLTMLLLVSGCDTCSASYPIGDQTTLQSTQNPESNDTKINGLVEPSTLPLVQPLPNLVTSNYDDLIDYIAQTDYYASIDSSNPIITVSEESDHEMYIHFNSNGDETFTIEYTEQGYQLKRHYISTQRFIYTQDQSEREAVLYINCSINYNGESKIPVEYFVSVYLPDDEEAKNNIVYYDPTNQSFYLEDDAGYFDQTIAFSDDLQDKMVNTMEYAISIFEDMDEKGMAFLMDIFFDFYHFPYVLMVEPVYGLPDVYDQTIYLSENDYLARPYNYPDQFILPEYPIELDDEGTFHQVYMDQYLDRNYRLLHTIITYTYTINDMVKPYDISIDTYIDGCFTESEALVDQHLYPAASTKSIYHWFDQYIDQTTFDDDHVTSSLEIMLLDGLVGDVGLFDDRIIFTTSLFQPGHMDGLIMPNPSYYVDQKVLG